MDYHWILRYLGNHESEAKVPVTLIGRCEIETTYEYDGMSRLKRLKDMNATETLFDRQYGYNNANQIAGITEPTRNRTFGYDNLDRLTSVVDATNGNESYGFDGVGNRTSSHLSNTYTYQPFNKLTATQTGTYTHDANGNTVTKSEGSKFWRYTYDYENRLTRAADRKATVRHQYDALGRRVAQLGGAKGSTKFTYDGDDVILDDAGGTLTKYINGPGIDNKLSLRTGSDVKYFLADHLGSTNALTDSTGAVTSSASYDSFGNQTGSLATRYSFTGRERDDVTGLMYYRARFYDPKLGRFLSEDPIGFEGGDINLYGYVWNSPLQYTDPLGLNGWGNDFAGWADERIEYARRFYQGDVQSWVRNGSVNTIADLASGVSDLFRVGTGVGQAMYCENLPDYRRMELVSADVVRGGGLFLTMAGPAAGRVGQNARNVTEVPTPKNPVIEWLGPDSRIITGPKGDKVVISSNGTRRVRFDLKHPHPHKNPHTHVEELVNKRWRKSGPIYPTDVNSW